MLRRQRLLTKPLAGGRRYDRRALSDHSAEGVTVRLASLVLLIGFTVLAGTGRAQAGNPLHHAIEATFDPASGALRVHDTIDLAPRDTFIFRLADWLTSV